MNHQQIYVSIISKAKSENRKRFNKKDDNYIYYEDHHIVPKCAGGNNNKINLVLLTAREHYVCHKLLTYIYKGNRKLIIAFYAMSHNKKYKTCVSSKDYEYAKILVNLAGMSKEQKDKISKSNTGKKHSEEQNKNQSDYQYRRSYEHQKNINEAIKGNKNASGKRTSEQIENIRNGAKGNKNASGKRTINQKDNIKENTRLAMQRPEVKENIRLGMIKRKAAKIDVKK